MINPIFGLFEFDLYGRTAYIYALVVTFLLFIVARRIVVSPFGLSLRTIRDNPFARPGRRHPGQPASDRDLHDCRGLCRRGGGLAGADDAIRLAGCDRPASLG